MLSVSSRHRIHSSFGWIPLFPFLDLSKKFERPMKFRVIRILNSNSNTWFGVFLWRRVPYLKFKILRCGEFEFIVFAFWFLSFFSSKFTRQMLLSKWLFDFYLVLFSVTIFKCPLTLTITSGLSRRETNFPPIEFSPTKGKFSGNVPGYRLQSRFIFKCNFDEIV